MRNRLELLSFSVFLSAAVGLGACDPDTATGDGQAGADQGGGDTGTTTFNPADGNNDNPGNSDTGGGGDGMN
ncbi:MAG: hypothetical protein AAF721_41195, partial [Myxococcota bacterium]